VPVAAAPPPVVAGRAVPGLQEFRTSGVWTAPPGVTHVLIEAWAGGGGGGGGSANGTTGGGGGGGGAYQRGVVRVTPGTAYEVSVGPAGGAGGMGRAGAAGGDTELRESTARVGVYVVRGGAGGGAGVEPDKPGAGGAGGRVQPPAGIARDGGDGGGGLVCPPAALTPTNCLRAASGGAGGGVPRGSVDLPSATGLGGAGGAGNAAGKPGAPGYVILQW
jgi:hypothetical protein